MIQNATTRELEAYGRKRGIRTQIRKIEGRKSGMYFVLSLNDDLFVNPKPIGKSIREAELWLDKHKVVI